MSNHDTEHPVCGKTWKQRGNRTGHCAKCHETFEGLSLFDWHQVLDAEGSVTCRNSSDAVWIEKGLRLVNGSWRGRELPAGTFALSASFLPGSTEVGEETDMRGAT